jgi:hypothetical protein
MLLYISKLSPAEITDIIKSMNAVGDDEKIKAVQASGIKAAGQKYFFLQNTSRSIYCKKAVSIPFFLTLSLRRLILV